MSGRVLILSILVPLLTVSCGDGPSGPSGPDHPTPSVLEAFFAGGWTPPDTSKGADCEVQLSWTVCPDGDFLEYSLFRSDYPGIEAQPESALVRLTTTEREDTTFLDMYVQWDRVYHYAVRTANRDSLHSWSNETSVQISPVTSYGGPDRLIQVIDVGPGPGGIASASSGDHAWAACYYDNTVYVLGHSYPYVYATVAVGGGPFDICSGSGHMYVSCAQSDEVISIRTSDNTIGSWAAVGEMPLGICMTPDGQRVYVCCYGSGEVWCLDAFTLEVIDIIPVGDGPWDICAHPSGEYLYLTCRLDGTVQVLRTSDNTVTATVDVAEPAGIVPSVTGDYVYVCSYSTDRVVRIRTADNSVEASVDVGTRPYSIAVTPNGMLAYVTCHFTERVYIIDLSIDAAVSYLEVGTRPNGVCLTSSGEYLYVSSSSSNTVHVFGYDN